MSSNANTTDTAETAAPKLAAARNRALRANEESNLSPRVLRNQITGTRSGNTPADDDERKPAARANSETGNNDVNELSSQFGSMQLYEDQREPPEDDSAQAAIDKQAREFVQGVQHVCIGLESDAAPGILPIEEAVLLTMTKRLLAKKEEFIAANEPCTVHIGYTHLPFATFGENWELHVGPLTADASIWASLYPNNCETFTMMARLNGNDSFTFRQGASEPSQQVSTVKTPTRYLPLVQFPSSMIETYLPGNAGNLLVREHHASLQELVDHFFNDSLPTPLPVPLNQGPVLLHYDPLSILAVPLRTIATPIPHATRSATSDNCCICLDPLHNKDTVCLKACPHKFHSECIQQALEQKRTTVFKCPICRKLVRDERSQMPSAIMVIKRCDKTRCDGHVHAGSIVIEYRVQGYASATTYLPETEEGRALLKRLKYAFCHGLTFKVGPPGRPLYFAILHKHSQTGGDTGFPDPTFFTDCNEQLDQAHVPPADAIEQ